MKSEKRLIAENDIYALFGRRGMAELHVADIDLLPRVDAVILPCKIGDTVWAIRNYRGTLHPMKGFVSEMFYLNDMRLAIVVKCIARGFWGKDIFATYGECVAEIERRRAENG